MELLYNPDRMPEEEIKATFVAREALVDELVELIKGQSDGAGVQHAVIIAPRGMGKTTVLLMVKFAIKDRGLADQWQAVKFPEESYGIYDLADLWIETLYLIAADTNDPALRHLADELKTKYPNNDELQEAAYAALKDWRRKHGRRLLLLVENFDQILEQINDERDNARLRDVMMNDGTLMLLGGATTFFKEARAYDQPLYNFFKIYDLVDLKFAQMQELLRRRAKVDRIADFETSLRRNLGRLRVLEYFTGGSPRLVLMLYRVVTQSDMNEVRRALEKLLDEVTPYYKAKIEILPPQQRKILDHIARISGQTNEGLTPKEIAEAVRLSQNQVSAQLKRLSELGYVRAANLRGRSSFYMLSEPLYAIWHQMRFGRSARERMNWLVSFLKVWYAAEEMGAESKRLERTFRYHLRANNTQRARDVLEHHRYLMEAMADTQDRLQAMERITRGHLRLNDVAAVKSELLASINLSDLPNGLMHRLVEAGCISPEQATKAKAQRSSADSTSSNKDLAEVVRALALAVEKERFADALLHVEKLHEIEPNDYAYWLRRAGALIGLGRIKEALTCTDQALKVKTDDPTVWVARGYALTKLGKPEEAVTSYDSALKINPEEYWAWFYRGLAFNELGRYKEAVESFDQGLKFEADHNSAWVQRGIALVYLDRYEEASTSFDHVPDLSSDANPHRHLFDFVRGIAQLESGHYQEALTIYDKVLKAEPDNAEVWYHRGMALHDLNDYEEAIASYNRALESEPDDIAVWIDRGQSLDKLGRYEEAQASYGHALDINPTDEVDWFSRGFLLNALERYEEALASYDRALQIDSENDAAWNNRGILLRKLDRYKEAIASYDRALELNSGNKIAWYNRGSDYLEIVVEYAQQKKFDLAKESWNEALASGEKSNDKDWPDEVTKSLLEVAKTGHLEFARQLIAEAGMEEQLFPLARAIDYLQSGKEAIIEKLSPEMRGIVEEVVAKLRTAASD